MIIRKFNAEGMKEFETFVLHAKKQYKSKQIVDVVPPELISDSLFSDATEYEVPDGPVTFASKRDIGEFFCKIIPDHEHDTARLDKALWTWLAAKYFDEITDERRKIREARAYIASISYQDFYRHLLLGPYFIYFSARDNPERVQVLLYDEPATMNEVMVQFGSYQTLLQNKELQQVVQRLYFDTSNGKIKKGAGGKEAGTPRRLMDFFRQIELNYDLSSIQEESFWNMLPKEFGRFKGSPPVSA
jgi:hypothetical protein